ncbi:MAG: hypothetical protein GY777_16280, partial [Candidatus Brocadiaceae bacterium]|nr:hypothetical protein [Candidatus Brocadiaceae bacterium]
GVAEFKEKGETSTLDIQNLKSQMNQGTLNAKTCYQAFKKIGIDYGDGYRGIRELYQGENQVLARLSLPSFVQDTQSEYVLHPSLMDAALQSSIGLVLNNGGSANGNEVLLYPSLPYALESLEVLGSCTSEMYAWVRYSGGSALSDKIQKLDIDLCDEQGNVCVKMRGLETKELEKDYIDYKVSAERTFDKIPVNEAHLAYFEEVWGNEKNPGTIDKTEKTLICFLSDSRRQKEFIEYIHSTSPKSQIIFISQG